ncbi:MAG: hypothetical protein AAFW89_12980 [Bacteroidota bacterium]
MQASINQTISKRSLLGYREFFGLLTQQNADNPTIRTLINDFDFDITFTRTDTGYYECQLNGVDREKIFAFTNTPPGEDVMNRANVQISLLTPTIILLTQSPIFDSIGECENSDNIAIDLPIVIRVVD